VNYERSNEEQSKEYRDTLAGKVKDMRNSNPENPEQARAKAGGYLEAVKKHDKNYDLALKSHIETQKSHLEENEIIADSRWQEKAMAEDKFNDDLVDEYIKEGKRKHSSSVALQKTDEKGYIDREAVGQELMDSLKAIDEAYENGVVLGDNFPFDYLHEKIDWTKYDSQALQKYVDELQERIGRIRYVFSQENLTTKRGKYAGINKVTRCDGSHEAESYHPTNFECDRKKDRPNFGSSKYNAVARAAIFREDAEARFRKVRLLLERFKRMPEQVDAAKKGDK